MKESRRSSEPCEDLNKGRSSAELSLQLEEEQEMLAKLQADEDEKTRLREQREEKERQRRELEREKRELEREREQAERERKELEEERRRAERITSAEQDERRRQKELLLARMKAIDDGTVNSSDDAGPATYGPTSSKRVVAAAEDVNGAVPGKYRSSFLTETDTSDLGGRALQKRQVVADDDDVNGAVFGGYRPSFLAGSTSSAKTKKSSSTMRRDAASRPRNNLLVFDDDDDDLTKPSEPQKPASPDFSLLSNQGEMGAGDRHDKHLLPRRPRQQATTMNGVVNDLSDDIEEVIL